MSSTGFDLGFDLYKVVILSAILFTIRSPVAFAVFNVLFKEVLAGSVSALVVVSINFLPHLSTKFLAKDKNP